MINSRDFKILLVEDDDLQGPFLKILLEQFCHEVHLVRTVRDAVAEFGTCAIDILISDIGLPDGDGVELITELRKIYGNRFCALALSDKGTRDDVYRAVTAGFDTYLTKPASIDQIQNHIQRLGGRLNPLPTGARL